MIQLNTKSQAGIALLIFLVVLLGMVGAVGVELLNRKVETVNRDKALHDSAVLQKAKQALLNYAVDYAIDSNLEEMGRLPCPDKTFNAIPEGNQDGSCGVRHANSAGFLPWKTLGIDVLRDSNGECLWYVVSGDYKGSPKADMVNEDTNGLLWVQNENGQAYHGTDPGDRPIAIIIAPGGILQGQIRNLDNGGMVYCQGNYIEANYLESGGSVNYVTDHVNTADAIWTYVYASLSSRLENSNFNDKIVWISKNDYWAAVKAQGDLDVTVGSPISQLTTALAQCLADYGKNVITNPVLNENNWLPWPAAIVGFADYRNDADDGLANEYRDPLIPGFLIGRFPQDITNSDTFETTDTTTLITLYSDMGDILEDCLTPVQKQLWENWKDHFFYAVSEDFEMQNGITSALASACNSIGDCLTVNANGKDYAAIVFYADSVTTVQSRNSVPVDVDQKNDLPNYLEPLNADGDIDYFSNIGDLVSCIEVVGNLFIVTDCT